ncbi:MAG TPA: flavin reductase family protein [Candidatus Baltobacteraceae bacterium]|nr:flavin reductase family protein [Candidatus Baltobacteraceae bacterium]
MELHLAELDPKARYKLLIGLVYPRPIALVSTINANGVLNAAPFSFFNVVADEPPLVMLSFNRRSNGELKDTVKNIRRTKEFVVNLVDETIANPMLTSGQELPETESEFAVAGFTPVPSVTVSPPRIREAPASFECRLYQHIEIGPARDIMLGEILRAHVREGIVDQATWRVSESYRPIGRLYGERYCTTRQRFDLPGPLPA